MPPRGYDILVMPDAPVYYHNKKWVFAHRRIGNLLLFLGIAVLFFFVPLLLLQHRGVALKPPSPDSPIIRPCFSVYYELEQSHFFLHTQAETEFV